VKLGTSHYFGVQVDIDEYSARVIDYH